MIVFIKHRTKALNVQYTSGHGSPLPPPSVCTPCKQYKYNKRNFGPMLFKDDHSLTIYV